MKKLHKRYPILLILFLFLCISLALTADYVLQRKLKTVQEQLLYFISEESRAQVSYTSLTMQGLALQVENLILTDQNNASRELVHIDNLKLHLTLREILSIRMTVPTITKIQINTLHANINTESDQQFIDNLINKFQQNGTTQNLNIDAHNVNLIITHGSNSMELRYLSFQGLLDENDFALSGNSSVTMKYAGQRTLANFRFVIQRNLKTRKTLGDLSLFDIHHNNIYILTQRFKLEMEDDFIRIANTNLAGFAMNFVMDTKKRTWKTDISLNHFIPDTVFLINEPGQYLSSLISSRMNGHVHISSELNSLQLHIENFAVPNLGMAEIQLLGAGSWDSINFQNASFRIPREQEELFINYTGSLDLKTLYPNGSIAIKGFPVANQMLLSANVNIEPGTRGIALTSKNARLASLDIPHLAADIFIQEGELKGNTYLSLNRQHERQIDSSFSINQRGLVLFNIALNRFPLKSFLHATGRAEGSIATFLASQNPTISSKNIILRYSENSLIINSNNVAVINNGTRVGDFSVLFSNNKLALTLKKLDFPNVKMQGNFQTFFDATGISATANLAINGLRYTATANYDENNELDLQLYYNQKSVLLLQYFRESSKNDVFSIVSNALPFRIFQRNININFNMNGMTVDKQLQARFQYFRVSEAKTGQSISLQATFNRDAGKIFNLQYQNSNVQFIGAGSFALNQQLLAELSLSVPDSDEQYVLAFFQNQEGHVITMNAKSVPAKRLKLPGTGKTEFSLKIDDVLANPSIHVNAKYLDYITIDNSKVEIASTIFLDKNVFSIKDLAASYRNMNFSIPDASIDFSTGRIHGNAMYITDFSKKQIDLSGNFAEPAPLKRLQDLLALLQADLAMQLSITDIQGNSEKFSITQNENFFKILSAEQFSLIVRQDKQIRGTLNYDNLRLIISGSLAWDDIYVALELSNFNINKISPLYISPHFYLDAGRIQGNFLLTGPLNDLNVNSEFAIVAARGKTEFSPEILGPATLRLAIKDKVFYLLDSYVPVANGGGNVSAMVWQGENQVFNWQLNITSQTILGLYINYEFGPIFADGYARGWIQIGNVLNKSKDIYVRGDIQIHNSELSLIDFEYINAKIPDVDNLLVDLKITTNNLVRFIWPRSAAPVFRATFMPAEELHIVLDPINNINYLDGSPRFLGGDIYYFSKNFYIKKASLVFNKNAFTLLPRINLLAELQQRTTNNEIIRIYLEAVNQDFNTFRPNIFSNPPLPQNELVELLKQNLLPRSQDPSTASTTVSDLLIYGTDIFTQFNVINNFEDVIRNSLKLDIFSLRTPVIQNILSSAINQSVDNSQKNNFLHYLANTSLVIGKYIGENIFAEFTMEFDQNRSGLTKSTLDFYTQLRMSVTTPIINVEWLFRPVDLTKPTINDTQIALSWTFRD